ncbi:XdhC family protein [Marinobacter sp. SS21]|uniref:XdhC family protein n=1 Tax=Marinobacter sp. SS21 TaxID=2979460 RepID=UPI00232E0923|nr:XdhC family protein [Marinobacter sp. SS21]MDC0663875.1 XdhC family protein [Marinobacter sp. SS21]
MRSQPQQVLTTVAQWLSQGQRVWLCTIVETWGSSPRPAGSWLALNAAGDWVGSVSGGCLEEDLILRCVEQQPDQVQLIDYGVSDSDRDTFQLPCGGRIRLLLEPMGQASHGTHVSRLLAALERREAVARDVCLQTGEFGMRRPEAVSKTVQISAERLVHALSPHCQLLLVGVGEVAHYVAEFALAADFEVSLCEPRETFARGWRNEGVPLLRALPDDLVMSRFGDGWCGILALAHDPRVDDLALMAALRSDAFYVGAMGSARTSAARRQRLASLGMTDAELERLQAPIGLPLPSKTPAEIAIAIVADLIRARHDLLVPSTPL